MRRFLRTFRADDSGITGVEYGFLASLIAVALASEMFSVGTEVRENFELVETEYIAIQH